mgnify:CR=1 FL=1
MGYRRYRGPVHTLEQASLADMPDAIRCETCGRVRQMHAFSLIQTLGKKHDAAKIMLGVATAGFWCKYGRHKTAVTIRAPMQWAD